MKHDLLVLVLALASAAAPAAVLFTTAAAPNTAISELEVAADKTIRVRRTWPCCDRCGGCSINSDLPECQCHDLVRRCHASCRSCVRSPLSVEPPLFQCTDRIPGY
ncbi:Bowman-Birk type trypsin inhibitor-like isoform X2 [Zingiber officinale]|uniref:Bowman-Birk type trypsin inhibitor-like isoform X2 n=1 Tax=Zingiber officinale TaxID=94328 RepID=UPI001C4D27AE|nr:Bowman-Birk type trypsin inhibitor-like isoform X2 [Zingiber officinale]